jgi:hypothetical protein
MSIPGVGPIISSAVVAAIGNGAGFKQGRDFAAWLGLISKQESTGDRTILGKISKRGNKYVRTLFVQAAHVVLERTRTARQGLWPWIEQASKRRAVMLISRGSPPMPDKGSLRSTKGIPATPGRVPAQTCSYSALICATLTIATPASSEALQANTRDSLSCSQPTSTTKLHSVGRTVSQKRCHRLDSRVRKLLVHGQLTARQLNTTDAG